MERHELERWLCGPDVPVARPVSVATALGLSGKALADTTLLRTLEQVRSLRFTLALLHDAFAADADLQEWLETPRDELDGMSPRNALVSGRAFVVERLAVTVWNEAAMVAEVA